MEKISKIVLKAIGLPCEPITIRHKKAVRKPGDKLVSWKFQGNPKNPLDSDWWQFTLWVNGQRVSWRHPRTRRSNGKGTPLDSRYKPS